MVDVHKLAIIVVAVIVVLVIMDFLYHYWIYKDKKKELIEKNRGVQ